MEMLHHHGDVTPPWRCYTTMEMLHHHGDVTPLWFINWEIASSSLICSAPGLPNWGGLVGRMYAAAKEPEDG